MLSALDHMAVRKNPPPADIECQLAPGPPVSRLAPLDFAAVHAAGGAVTRGCRFDRTLCPTTDALCLQALDHAIAIMVAFRGGEPDDPGAVISTLVSLIAEADSRLTDTVADARERGYTWDQVASRLGTTIPAARYRYAQYAGWQRGWQEAGIP